MKILFISFSLGYGSLMYWDEILSKIKEVYPDFEVYTAVDELTTKNKKLSVQKKIKRFKYSNVENTELNQINLPTPTFLWDLIRNKRDLIILNEFNLASMYVVMSQKLFFRKTRLLLLVESDPSLGDVKKKHSLFRNLYRRIITGGVDIIMTNNKLGKQYLTTILQADIDKIVQKPYLTSSIICETEKKSNTNDVKLLFVGQLVERKGLPYLLKAIKHLKEMDVQNFTLTIVGDGVQKESLMDYCQKHSLNNIVFTGKIPYEEVKHHYCRADIFVLPTLHDYRALVGFEALSAGLSIIDSKFNGARFEVVKEGVNGFVVDPTDTLDFAKKLEKIIGNGELLQNFKAMSKIRSQQYMRDVCIDNLLLAIQRALHAK